MSLKNITASLLTLATVATASVETLAQSANLTKVSQCNQIITITNAAVRDAKSATNNGQTSNPESLLRAANMMDSAAARLENVSITDPTLQVYRAEFASMYRETSQATREFVVAFNAQNRSDAEIALTELQQATAPEEQLVAGLNDYCAE